MPKNINVDILSSNGLIYGINLTMYNGDYMILMDDQTTIPIDLVIKKDQSVPLS